MLAAVSRARHLLGDSAELVVNFIRKQINQDGGFRGRSSQSDLYYTVFGVESLLALEADIPRDHILSYLNKFGDGVSLDIIHLASLVRCLADLSQQMLEANNRGRIVQQIEKYRCADGGYSNSTGTKHGTAYGCFLALGAYHDLNMEVEDTTALANCVKSLQTRNGAYSNELTIEAGSTPATAAALAVLHYLNEPVSSSSTDWLLSRLHPEGGFVAMPATPVPDLLSTATTLHALALMGISTDNIKEQCLDFIDSLWSTEGGFYGNRADKVLDCEYTYYGLLALGHLNDSDGH